MKSAALLATILLLLLAPDESRALVLMLEENAHGELDTVKNCTCLFDVPCLPVTLELFCTCVDRPLADAAAAWYDDAVTVCCASLTSPGAGRALSALLDFARVERLTLRECDGLASANASALAVFALRDLTVHAAAGAAFPLQFVALADHDLGATAQAYRDHHVTIVDRRVLDGGAELRAVSAIVAADDPSDFLQEAIGHAPSGFGAKSDGTVMATIMFY